MTLYETIFTRLSVRSYKEAPLDAGTLFAIEEYLDKAKQLPGQTVRFEIVTKDKFKGGFAPYAILAFSPDNDEALVNIGYTLQGVDLWLQSQGLGSIWCGMATPLDKGSDFRILLGFGATELALRSSEDAFKRKKLSEMSNEDNPVARAARLAPSAVNLQPWMLSFSEGQVTVHVNVRGLGRVLPGKFWLFDLGIVLRHVELALEHEGKTLQAPAFSGGRKNTAITVRYEPA
jgi:hypothetical protein